MPPKQKLTNAQKQANYRARRDLDPERRQAYIEGKKTKYREDLQKGKRLAAKDLSQRQLRQQCKQWKTNKRNSRKPKTAPLAGQMTPPRSPEDQPPQSSQKSRGRKKIAKDRAKCYRDNKRLQANLESERKRAEKFRKRYERLHQSTKATSTNKGMLSPCSKTKKLLRCFGEKDLKKKNNPVARTLNFHYTLLHSIKERYRRAKSQKERRVICSYMTGVKLMRKYKLQKWAEGQLPLSHRRWQLDPFENGYNRKSKTNPVISLVKDFYCRDDVSRMTTGKKNTITRTKLKMQRRLLTDTLQNLHKKFLSEHTQKVSYSYFCALRPFWVVEPTELDRETCQCKVHENTQFMADKLFSLNVLNTNNLEQLVTEMVCDDDSKACAYGECIVCKNKKCNFNPPDDAVVSRPITYSQWKLKKVPRVTTDDENAKNEQDLITVTKKEDVESTMKYLIADFMTSLQNSSDMPTTLGGNMGCTKLCGRTCVQMSVCCMSISARITHVSTQMKRKVCTLVVPMNKHLSILEFSMWVKTPFLFALSQNAGNMTHQPYGPT